jgi:hypothetical protein
MSDRSRQRDALLFATRHPLRHLLLVASKAN